MIHFHSIRWKNLLSYGNNWTTIDLLKERKSLIRGVTGHGKTSLLDAISFALFNKSFRGINKPNLVNSINEKGLLVELTFKKGQNVFRIERGLKPTVFNIYKNDKLIDQESSAKDYQDFLERDILGFSFNSFSQIIVLGSTSFVPFMCLPAKARRDIVENILNIDIFSSMNESLKERISAWKAQIKDLELREEINRTKIETNQKFLATLAENKERRIQEEEEHFAKLGERFLKTSKGLEPLEKEETRLKGEIKRFIEQEKELSDVVQSIRQLEKEISRLRSDGEFYRENNNCPTCLQKIDNDFKDKMISEKTREISTLEKSQRAFVQIRKAREGDLQGKQEIESALESVRDKMEQKKIELATLKVQLKDTKQSISRLKKLPVQSEDFETELNTLKEEEIALESERKTLLENGETFQYAQELLKDTGVKTRIIKQYLPIINKTINRYLKTLDFFVGFEFDENFNESIRSRHRDEFTYNNFSEGEKMKINLALIFTWRHIAKLNNSVSTNLLVMDESFDRFMDPNLLFETLKILDSLPKKIRVFVISHLPQAQEVFDRTLQVTKRNSFSYIEDI